MRTMATRRPYKDQLRKVSCEAGTAHRLKNEEEEESWRQGDQMAAQREQEQKLEDILKHRRMEGGSLQLEVMRKVLELVVHERMSQGKWVKGFKEKKKVSGWSMEEMRRKPNVAVEVDAEEMRKWRGVSQSEMDQCWKNLADRMEEEGLNKYKVEDSKKRGFQRCSSGKEKGAQKQEIQSKKVVRRLLGKKFLFVWRIQLAPSAEQAGGVNGRGRDEAAAKNGDYERSDKDSELLAADCEKAWIHTGREDTMQQWYNWLEVEQSGKWPEQACTTTEMV